MAMAYNSTHANIHLFYPGKKLIIKLEDEISSVKRKKKSKQDKKNKLKK